MKPQDSVFAHIALMIEKAATFAAAESAAQKVLAERDRARQAAKPSSRKRESIAQAQDRLDDL
jgi:hypothetical protein